MIASARAATTCTVVAATACGAPADERPPLPWDRQRLGAPPVVSDNPTTAAKAELGRLLFHDPVLSRDAAVACVTCHGQDWGLSDGLPVSVGIDGVGPAGTGRRGPNVTRRNSGTLWNVAYRERLMWDGRASSLEAQVLLPLQSEVEMGRDVDDLVSTLRGIDGYVTRFEAAFGRSVTLIDVQRAIAAFERTLVSDDAPYDRYVAGDSGALSDAAVRGMWLFAEVGCARCHEPPRFEREQYDRVHACETHGARVADRGRMEVTAAAADAGAFRVPTLRNIRETAPYFHDGCADTLSDAVHDPDRPLSADERADIVEFLSKGLMDKLQEPDRPATVPSGLPVPIDGYGIPR